MSRIGRILGAGHATGVGSLPHADAGAAVDLVLSATPRLPAIPELPALDPREAMLPRVLGALSGIEVHADGSFEVVGELGEPDPMLDPDAHAGLLTFLDRLSDEGDRSRTVKLQLAGPLTLGMALVDAGVEPGVAFERGAALCSAWASTLVESVSPHVGGADPVVFLDEPSLVVWREGEPPIVHEDAVDVLSGVLASIDAVTGVHVCGDGDRRIAIEAGPDVVGFPVQPSVLDDGVALSRYLDGGGWVAWGAVPTDRPVGEQIDHWWGQLVQLWCDLTRGGCDPITLRTQSIVTPACGLAHHTEGQARKILEHCIEVGERVKEQAVATRLSIGA